MNLDSVTAYTALGRGKRRRDPNSKFKNLTDAAAELGIAPHSLRSWIDRHGFPTRQGDHPKLTGRFVDMEDLKAAYQPNPKQQEVGRRNQQIKAAYKTGDIAKLRELGAL